MVLKVVALQNMLTKLIGGQLHRTQSSSLFDAESRFITRDLWPDSARLHKGRFAEEQTSTEICSRKTFWLEHRVYRSCAARQAPCALQELVEFADDHDVTPYVGLGNKAAAVGDVARSAQRTPWRGPS